MLFHRSNSTSHRCGLRAQSLTLAVALPLVLFASLPAQAGFLDIFRRSTGGQPTGTSRGGAIRDEACSPDALAKLAGQELVALVPEIKALTTEAVPELLVYVPIGKNTESNLALKFTLLQEHAAEGLKPVTESVISAIPDEPGLVRLQFPSDVPLVPGDTYIWQLNLVCQASAATGADATATATTASGSTPSGTIDLDTITLDGGAALAVEQPTTATPLPPATSAAPQQLLRGEVERVPETPELRSELAKVAPRDRYQVYVDNNLWFDMVVAMADSQPPAWTELLAEFDLADIDPIPQIIVVGSLTE